MSSEADLEEDKPHSTGIFVPDEATETYSSEHVFVPPHYDGYVDSVMLTNGAIQDRICKLARDVRSAYPGVTIHLVCVLKGGAAFFHDLQRHLRVYHDYLSPAAASGSYIPFTLDFVRCKSYEGTSSSGSVEVTGMSDFQNLRGRHVLLVEDMIDTGRTMSKVVPHLRQYVGETGSVRVCALFQKRTPLSCGFEADFTGFTIPNRFVVGYVSR
uniref:Phosphoribosyltransferase domain-containing protein n=1 Tax=Corethron hystrix TaxID=216773 RepID=A0A6U5EGW1_9STRA